MARLLALESLSCWSVVAAVGVRALLALEHGRGCWRWSVRRVGVVSECGSLCRVWHEPVGGQ
jgi:hypothetical protein